MKKIKKTIQNIKTGKKGVWIIIFAFATLIILILFLYFVITSKNASKPDTGESPKNQILNPPSYSPDENITEIIPDFSDNAATQPELLTEPDETSEITETTMSDNANNSDNTEETTLPPVKAKRVYQEEFDSLRAKYGGNEDIIGIVKIPGTVIYYPVAHYQYNNEYYLGKNLFKYDSAAGSICMDYENSVDRYDPSTVLYGHQMYSNSMFHTISYYTDENFFNEHRYVIFNTIYENNVWEVFSFFSTNISFNYIKVFFSSESDFLDLAAQLKEKSQYDTGIDIKEGDRILILSTCTNQERDTRYVLCARMIKNKDNIPPDIAEQMANAVEDFK